MPDYEYSDVKYADFIAALEVYLRRLEDQWRSDRSAFQRFWWNINPAIEDVDDAVDILYNEIMDAVDQQGISPNVGQALSPIAAQIYQTVLGTRAKYAWEKKYGEAVKDWQADVQKAVQADWGNRFQYAQWEVASGLAKRKFQWQQQQAEWQRKTEAQKGMWGDWQQQQQLQQYRQAALGVGIGRRMESRLEGQSQPQEADRERLWEGYRREQIAGLDPDRDWLKIRDWKQKPNPYKEDPESATDERHWAEAELEKAQGWAKTAKELLESVKGPEDYLTKQEMDYVYAADDAKKNALRRVAEAQQKEQDWITQQGAFAGAGAGGTGYETATGMAYGGSPYVAPEPRMPKTPSWMAKIYPELGKRLPEKGTGFTPLTLSGQQWGALKPSQQQRWMGMAEYYGEKPLDKLAQMRRMQPRTPQVARRWAPARQMA